jgi:hypothetical protein
MKTWLLSTAMLSTGLTLGTALRPAPAQRAEMLEVLRHFSLVELDDGQGRLVKTVRISGANLQIVNGLGATNGNPGDPYATEPGSTAMNGLGNLIIGYGELPLSSTADRTGSHYLVVGPGHSYSSFGAALVGESHRSTAPYAAVLGGKNNRSIGAFASVSGGEGNTASGSGATVSGGSGNLASGYAASILGGLRCLASGTDASVAGGYKSRATGDLSSVGGGDRCEANGIYSSASGGSARIADGAQDWVAGSLNEDN